jgi:hypothetical protein
MCRKMIAIYEEKRGIEMEMDEGTLPGWMRCQHAVPNICRPWVLCKCQERRVYANYRCLSFKESSALLAPKALFILLDLSFCDRLHCSLLDIGIILRWWWASVEC